MTESKKLAGKTALITGASRGIGRAIAEGFSAAGADLVIVARNDKALTELAKKLHERGTKVLAQVADIGQQSEIDAVFARVEKDRIGLDILVNNAAIMIKRRLEEYQREDFNQMIAVNVAAPLYFSQKAIPLMKARGCGVIVNMSSLSGCFGVQKFPGFGVYDMSKYALWGLTEMLAIENMENNIRVNQLSLSAVDTEMFRSVAPPHLKANLSLEEVAKHVVHLASPDSAPLTGENIILTGMAPAR